MNDGKVVGATYPCGQLPVLEAFQVSGEPGDAVFCVPQLLPVSLLVTYMVPFTFADELKVPWKFK